MERNKKKQQNTGEQSKTETKLQNNTTSSFKNNTTWNGTDMKSVMILIPSPVFTHRAQKKRTGLGTKDVWQKQEQTNISSIQKQLKPIEPWFDTKKTMSDMVFNSKQSLKHLHHNPYTGF